MRAEADAVLFLYTLVVRGGVSSDYMSSWPLARFQVKVVWRWTQRGLLDD